jgi:hypothetical protein
MPEGAPPPWLINMQRYGPPPSYPRLRIPGLNAPLPEGARWGYHAGGWGKPPVDEVISFSKLDFLKCVVWKTSVWRRFWYHCS